MSARVGVAQRIVVGVSGGVDSSVAALLLRDNVQHRHDIERAYLRAIATAQHVAAGMPMASDEEIIRRHDICMACEFFKDNSCSKCGCPVYRDKKFISKLAWADQSCPVGKW